MTTNFKKIKLFLIGLLVALVVLLNLYMLTKVLTNQITLDTIENRASVGY